MDKGIPVVVRMRVECARCGHAEDDIYEFDLPLTKAQPMGARAGQVLGVRRVGADASGADAAKGVGTAIDVR